MAATNHLEFDNEKGETLEKKYIQLLERHLSLLEAKPEAGDPANHARLHRLSISTHPGQDLHLPNDIGKGDDSAPPDNGRIRYRMKRFNQDGFQVEEKHDPKVLEGVQSTATNTVATFMLYFDRAKNHTETEIKIESEAVRSILQESLRHYPGYHWKNPNLTLFAPFEPLIHNWDTLTKAANEKPDDEGCQGLKDILDAVMVSKEVKGYFETRETTGESVGFDFLWTIFPPGELIILPNSFMKQNHQVFIVREAARREDDHGERKYMAITCWAYDWDVPRRSFNRVAVELKVDFYKGQRLITSLPCYPLKCYNGDLIKLKKDLIDRGKRFRQLCMRSKGRQMFEYDDLAYLRGSGVRQVQGSQSSSLSDDTSFIQRLAGLRRVRRSTTSMVTSKSGRPLTLKGKVMVDFESYVRHGPTEPTPMGELTLADEDEDDECRCNVCMEDGGPKHNQKYGWDGNKGDEDDSFCDDQYLICPPRVLGYHLMEKKWVELQVQHVRDIERRQVADAFKKLELNSQKKDLIEQLVRGHSNDKIAKNTPRSQMNDLTKGKGEGLVILLHGPPGVGKTLTAGEYSLFIYRYDADISSESIAQATEKPLFPIGVGDVTTDPSLVEKRLEQLFELAEVWQAVMLFDEADVFLESRSATTDVTRVGLVSVLLRVLEYYQGILILTTNRITSFDIAVQSRINLAIKFEDLIEKQKKNIFQNLINQLDDEYVENKSDIFRWMEDDEQATRSFSKLNGRQVRNIVFSAASLAGNRESGQNVLRLKDIERMLKETVEFHKDLDDLTKAARKKNEV